MSYPQTRMRRLRQSPAMRRLVREIALSIDNFVYPLFVCEGSGVKRPIDSMADCFYFSPDMLAEEIKEISALKIPAVLLFGLPDKKDAAASQAYADNGFFHRAIREIKKKNT